MLVIQEYCGLRGVQLSESQTRIDFDVCDVTLSVYPHRTSLKNMPGHGGNRTYDLWNTSPQWPGIFFKLVRCGYSLRVTSQTSYSPECITPTQKKIRIDFIFKYNLYFTLKWG